jgi:lipopolysaccharide biosynthesis glycosyltransferase
MLGIVMATDRQFLAYANAAIISIRQYNSQIPIQIFVCDPLPELEEQWKDLDVTLLKVDTTSVESSRVSKKDRMIIRTRYTKIKAITENNFDPCLYLDCDIVACSDVGTIGSCLDLGSNDIYALLRRPKIPSLFEWRWLYFTDPDSLTIQSITNLINQTFATDYSVNQIEKLKCWNGGVLYGTSKAMKILGERWLSFYLRLTLGELRRRFIPNDQLSLWLALNQLQNSISIKELPLEWNFMPGHVEGSLNTDLDRFIRSYGVKILHFAQNKDDEWAVALREQIVAEFEYKCASRKNDSTAKRSAAAR